MPVYKYHVRRSEVETTWISLIGWPHKTSIKYVYLLPSLSGEKKYDPCLCKSYNRRANVTSLCKLFPLLAFWHNGKNTGKKRWLKQKGIFFFELQKHSSRLLLSLPGEVLLLRLTLNKTERLPWGCPGVTHRNNRQNLNK